MGQQLSTQQVQSAFPHPTEAVSIGWNFFKSNIGIAALTLGLSLASLAIADVLLDRVDDDSSGGTFAAMMVASFVAIMVGALFELGLFRRALDFWDETHGLATPRSGSEAFSAAIDGAKPRVLPYLGWAIFLTVIIVVGMVIALVIAGMIGETAAVITIILMVVLAYLLDFLTAFYSVAAADRPGNPLTRSIHVFKGHFWRIVGTYLLYGVGIVVAVIPAAVVAAVFDNSSVATFIAAAAALIIAFVVQGMLAGTQTAMYRAVYPPVANPT